MDIIKQINEKREAKNNATREPILYSAEPM